MEISSPGLDRPLKKEKDFARSIGKDVEIKLYKALNKEKEFVGVLTDYDKETITIELDENLPDDEIRIHCRRMTEELQKIQEAFASGHTETKRLVLYQGDLECYVDVLDILFFETEGTIVSEERG